MRLRTILILAAAPLGVAIAQNTAATTAQAVAVATPRRDAVHNVDPSHMYHRVYARVPLVGSGTLKDPYRPQLSPGPTAVANNHNGILAYTMQLSDDGKWALVEFVGATPQDLQSVSSAVGPNVQVFERGKNTQAEIEAAFQVYKKDFKLDSFTTRAQ